jgi:hypothetical protein
MASLEDMPPCQSPWKHCQKPLANRSPKFTEFKSQNKRAGDPMPRLHGDEIHQGRPGWSTTQVIWQKCNFSTSSTLWFGCVSTHSHSEHIMSMKWKSTSNGKWFDTFLYKW